MNFMNLFPMENQKPNWNIVIGTTGLASLLIGFLMGGPKKKVTKKAPEVFEDFEGTNQVINTKKDIHIPRENYLLEDALINSLQNSSLSLQTEKFPKVSIENGILNIGESFESPKGFNISLKNN